MNTGDLLVLAAIGVYFIAVIAIGLSYTRRSNKSSSEYFLGGRKIGPWFTALSAEASDMSGYLLMGLPGLAYFSGAADAGWTAIGLAVGTYLNWKFVAQRLRRYTEKAGDAITLPEFYSNRFHDDKNHIATIAAIITFVFFCVYAGSCFVTCGKLFHTLFGFDYAAMMMVGAVIVFLYTMMGGYLSVVATDFLQGMLMIFALVVVIVGSITMAGGLDNTVAFLQDIPGYLSMTASAVPALSEAGEQIVQNGQPLFGDPSGFGILAIVSAMAWGLGYFGMPQILIRFMSIRDDAEIKQSRIIACVWVVISMFCAIMIGIIGRYLFPDALLTQSSAENIFIVLSQWLLPSFFCGIVVSGILAASMSSASAYLLITGSSIAENIFHGVFKRDATDKQILIVSRITLVCVLLFGIAVAWNENSVIFTVVSYAWAGLGASFGPLTLFSLYWRRTTKPAAIAGMLTGGITVIVWSNFIKPLGGVFGVYELLPAFILGCIVIVVVSLLTKEPSQEIYDEFDHYMDEEKPAAA